MMKLLLHSIMDTNANTEHIKIYLQNQSIKFMVPLDIYLKDQIPSLYLRLNFRKSVHITLQNNFRL